MNLALRLSFLTFSLSPVQLFAMQIQLSEAESDAKVLEASADSIIERYNNFVESEMKQSRLSKYEKANIKTFLYWFAKLDSSNKWLEHSSYFSYYL